MDKMRSGEEINAVRAIRARLGLDSDGAELGGHLNTTEFNKVTNDYYQLKEAGSWARSKPDGHAEELLKDRSGTVDTATTFRVLSMSDNIFYQNFAHQEDQWTPSFQRFPPSSPLTEEEYKKMHGLIKVNAQQREEDEKTKEGREYWAKFEEAHPPKGYKAAIQAYRSKHKPKLRGLPPAP